PWRRSLHILHHLERPTFAMALAALVREITAVNRQLADIPRRLFERWKLSTDEFEGVAKLLGEEPLIRQASRVPWPRLQRVLVAPRIEELLGYCHAVASVLDGTTEEIDLCRDKLAQPVDQLNPPPLITGADLKPLGIPPGPAYREILSAVRDAQLDHQITTRDEAVLLAKRLSP
ncbi:MAG: hypothetical protein SFU86_07080, partial [Pirellulaceae bacterium]|nr:hypothetical protein [Pirellulaceae bacterium]